MCDPKPVLPSIKISASALRCRFFAGIALLMVLGGLIACGHKTDTKATTVPIDTTVVDDDTLEVNDSVRFKQTERAR